MPATRRLSPRQFWLFKAALFIASLAPAAAYIYTIFYDPPPDPVQFLTHETGETALKFIIITLMMTPLRLMTGWATPLKLRGMFGLFAFFYVFGHLQIYVMLDLQLDFALFLEDIQDRVYITVGFAAFVLLVPLAITSNKYSIKRLGKKWQSLHRAVYAIAILGAVHYLWSERGEELGEPLAYLFVILFLLALRLPPVRDKIKRKPKPQSAAQA